MIKAAALVFLIAMFCSTLLRAETTDICLQETSHWHGQQTNADCVHSSDNCTYIMGFGSIFAPIQLTWFQNGRVCGWNYEGHRFSAINYADGKLSVKVYSAETSDETGSRIWKISYLADLRKVVGDTHVIWEGNSNETKEGGVEPVYVQRLRIFDESSDESEPLTPQSEAEVELIENEEEHEKLFLSQHGAYYCGDGGCDDNFVYVAVLESKKNDFLRRIRTSNFDIIDFKEINYNEHCSWLPEALFVADQENKVDLGPLNCFKIEAIPLRSPEVTMKLRDLSEVAYARRTGGGAGADATSFFLETEEFLLDDRTLDGFKAATHFDEAIRNFFPSSDHYEISEPIFTNNSLYWDVKGRGFALQKIKNPSPDQLAEWWKIRVQLVILQANAGEYFLSLGLPETRITSWGFSSPPSDAKFEVELTNDERFIAFRNRIMSAVAKNIKGSIFIP